MPNTKCIVVNVRALQFFERSRVAHVCCAEGGELGVLLGGGEQGRIVSKPKSVKEVS